MWIWLTISMLLVAACIIFGIYSLISSRTVKKIIFSTFNSSDVLKLAKIGTPFLYQQQNFSNLKNKLKSMEQTSVDQVYQLNKLQKRIESLEGENSVKISQDNASWDDSEDWEKMFYESRKEKKVLEEELNHVKNILEESEGQVGALEKQKACWMELKSELNNKLNEIHSLENLIEELQRRVDSAGEIEKILQEELTAARHLRIEYEALQKENTNLRSEADELAARLKEIKTQNVLTQHKIKRLTQLESLLEISEYEKMEIKNSVAQIITEM